MKARRGTQGGYRCEGRTPKTDEAEYMKPVSPRLSVNLSFCLRLCLFT